MVLAYPIDAGKFISIGCVRPLLLQYNRSFPYGYVPAAVFG